MKFINKFKTLILTLLIPTAFGLGAVGVENLRPAPPITLENPQVVDWVKPTTDAEWAEDVKEESLHLKYDEQLAAMLFSHKEKLVALEEDKKVEFECPECVRWELATENPDWTQREIDARYQRELNSSIWEVEKLKQSIERIEKEIALRKSGFVEVKKDSFVPAGDIERKKGGGFDSDGSKVRAPLGTTYYIDADCGTPGNGTTPTCNGDADDSFDDFDDFTEVSRSFGDIAIARRGTSAQYDDNTDLNFTSDGDSLNVITLQADYDDSWGDFASSTQTYTPVFGSKTMTASATITGIAANDWVFVQGDDEYKYAYEVASVSGTTLTLFLPYKGNQTGSGNTLNVMPDAPIWSIVTSANQVNIDNDDYWKIQGIHFRGTDSLAVVEIDSSAWHIFRDIILEGNGTSDTLLNCDDDTCLVYYYKGRMYNYFQGFDSDFGTGAMTLYVWDSLADANNTSSSVGTSPWGATYHFYETEFRNHSLGDLKPINGDNSNTLDGSGFIYGRNLQLLSTNATRRSNEGKGIFLEDYNGNAGDNRQYGFLDTSNGSPALQTSTTTVRAGGGPVSLLVTPSARFIPGLEPAEQMLFEYPIYTDTTSKTYTVYFKADDNTDWTANPTASEFWIECEYWETADHRKITKSSGTVDFQTDTDFDQTLSVTCQPNQDGVLYLRGWYSKTLEGGNSNLFYVDLTPEIS